MMTDMDRTSTSLEPSADLITEFERDWISAWNAHDIDRILSHYRDDVEFISPLAARAGAPHGKLSGRSALRAYFERGLATYPGLHFQPIAALGGVGSIALHYRAVEDREAIEVMELDAAGKVRRAVVHYTATLTEIGRSVDTVAQSASSPGGHRDGDAYQRPASPKQASR
jgi:hypothetical protein